MIQPETSTTSPQTESGTAIDSQWGRDKNGRFTKGHRFGFQPGQSGNPAGRPPEVRYVGEYMRDLLPLPVQELPQVAAGGRRPRCADGHVYRGQDVARRCLWREWLCPNASR